MPPMPANRSMNLNASLAHPRSATGALVPRQLFDFWGNFLLGEGSIVCSRA